MKLEEFEEILKRKYPIAEKHEVITEAHHFISSYLKELQSNIKETVNSRKVKIMPAKQNEKNIIIVENERVEFSILNEEIQVEYRENRESKEIDKLYVEENTLEVKSKKYNTKLNEELIGEYLKTIKIFQ